MPLKENDATAAGRSSRASNFSTSQHTGQSSQNTPADAFSSAAVMSMLRTTTELGDIDASNFKPIRHRPVRRPSANAPLSRTSSHYSQYSRAESIRSRTSNHSTREPAIPGAWPTPGLPPSGYDKQYFSTASDRPPPNRRSYSLTSSHHPSRLLGKNNKSAISLQSAGPPGNRPRFPDQHSARFRGPVLRPASPAWSDSYSAPQSRPSYSRPMPGPRTPSAYPFPPQSREQRMQRPALPMHPSLEGLRQGTPSNGRGNERFQSTPSPLRNNQDFARFKAPVNDAPYIGFVQRVKNLLEERVIGEDPPRTAPIASSKSDLAADDEPAELPATDPSVKRLTRDLVRAAIGTPSDGELVSTPNLLDSTFQVPDEPEADSSSVLAASDVETVASSTESYLNDKQHVLSENTADHEMKAASDLEDGEVPISANSSDASYSAHNLVAEPVELPAERTVNTLHSFSDDPERVKDRDRPFSVPYHEEQKTVQAPIRQSVPARFAPENIPESVVPLITDDLVQCEEEPAIDTQPSVHPPVETQLEQAEDATPKSRAASIADNKSDWATSIAARVLSAEKKNDWATSIAARVLSAPESQETQDRPQSSLEVIPASRVVSIANDKPLVDSRPASAGDIPVSWTRSSIAMRNSTLPPLPESKHSSLAVSEENISATQPSVYSTFPSTRQSAEIDPQFSSSRASVTSAPTENRFSAMKHFQSGLPDVTEDSQEEASTTNLRMLGSKPPAFRSARQRGDVRASSRNSSTPVPAALPNSYLSRKITNTKGIPSLEFSSTDLAKSLNQALGLRSSRSLESLKDEAIKKRARPRGVMLLSPPKPAAASKRDRYISYFAEDPNPQDVLNPEDTEKDLQEQEELINEIENISIPSVNGLSMRLSELFPTLKPSRSEADLTRSDQALEATIDDIRELGSQESMQRAGPRRASSDSITRTNDETIDSVLRDNRQSSTSRILLDKALPPLPTEETSPRSSHAIESGHAIPTTAADTTEIDIAVPPKRAEIVNKASSNSLHGTKSKQKLQLDVASTPGARPWNNAENFPWTSATPAVHLKEPGIEDDCDDEGSVSGVKTLRSKRSRRSSSVAGVDRGVRIARTMSPGPRMDASLIPLTERTSQDEHKEAMTKKSIIGSISRKLGKKHRNDKAGFSIDPEFLHPSDRLSVTPAGDRYPTTSLTPPVGLNIDETARSFFSDDSSEHEERRIGSIRKRLTRLSRKKAHSRALSTGEAASTHLMNSPTQENSVFSNSLAGISDPDVVLMMYDEPAIGMSKTEFRTKRFLEKVRKLWFRSGKLIRGIGHGRPHPQHTYEGSLYDDA